MQFWFVICQNFSIFKIFHIPLHKRMLKITWFCKNGVNCEKQILEELKRFDLHWLIESIPDGIWSLFPMPEGFWRMPLWKNTFKPSKCFKINLGVVRSIPWGPSGLAVRRLAQMQEVQSLLMQIYTIAL